MCSTVLWREVVGSENGRKWPFALEVTGLLVIRGGSTIHFERVQRGWLDTRWGSDAYCFSIILHELREFQKGCWSLVHQRRRDC